MGLHSHHLGVCVSLHLRCGSPDATGCHFRLLILHVHLRIQLAKGSVFRAQPVFIRARKESEERFWVAGRDWGK